MMNLDGSLDRAQALRLRYAPHTLALLLPLLLTAKQAAAQQPTSMDDRPEVSLYSTPSLGTPPDRAVHPGSFNPLDPFHAGLTFGSGYGWLTDRTVNEQHVGKGGATLHLSVDLEFFDLISFSGSAGTIFVGDQEGFTEGVIDQAGRTFDAKSSLGMTILGLSGGFRTPEYCLDVIQASGAWAGVFGFVRYGRAQISGGRFISNCVDCTSQDLPLSSGSFLESGVNLGIKRGDGIGISAIGGYRHYFAGASAAGEI